MLPNFELFINRLRKMYRHHRKWARRQGIECYRIYDADVPEFPVVVEVYGDFVHMAEYERDHGLSEMEYRIWRSGCREVVRDVLEIPEAHIFFKERRQQKGTQQYEKRAEQKVEKVVQEGGLKFIVNFTDYLDTGLFLDHRNTRQLVREQADGKQVLNLFAYTGSFTVYAASGGASGTLTIDLSNTYLDWAQRNLAINGLQGPRHRFLREDVLAWLCSAPAETFDLIVLDPPTFSNSKKMRDILDVQRDYPELVAGCLKRLSSRGILYFSTNFRKFKLDESLLPPCQVRNISGQTVPQDFRNKKIHHCFELRHSDGITD